MPQQMHAHQITGADADGDRFNGQDRQGDMQGEESWDHEVVHGMCGQRPQCINLLRHTHRAEFGSNGRAHAPGHHQARQHRSQFAAHRHADYRQRCGVHLDLVELEIGLRTQNHPRKSPGDENHRLGLHPHEINLIN